MQRNGAVRKRGFTLIELLTVVAIIALLIGLLVPAVNTARTHAKNASVRALVETLGKGCEMFNQDFGVYPQSSGGNPFEASTYNTNPQSPPLSGAQWLVLSLAGADLKGYVKKDKDNFYDSISPAGIDDQDWLDWYSLNPSWQTASPPLPEFRRSTFITLDGKMAKSPARYAADSGVVLNAPFQMGTSEWKNDKLPFALDAFNYPVLYYAATDHTKMPFTDKDDDKLGRYTQWDNAALTGTEKYGIAGLDLGAGVVSGRPGEYHYLHQVGWTRATGVNARPADGTFAAAVYDRGLFEQNMQSDGTGKVWPHRADTFLLISAGKDGQYGSSDDITNFER